MEEVMTFLTPILSAFAGGVITFLLTKDKVRMEIEKARSEKTTIDLGNYEKIVDVWKKISEDLRKEVEELTEEVIALREENQELKTEIQKLEQILKQSNIQA